MAYDFFMITLLNSVRTLKFSVFSKIILTRRSIKIKYMNLSFAIDGKGIYCILSCRIHNIYLESFELNVMEILAEKILITLLSWN